MAEDTASFAANILKPKIKVFGVGGGGNSALMRMGQHKKLDIDLIAVNTDSPVLHAIENLTQRQFNLAVQFRHTVLFQFSC